MICHKHGYANGVLCQMCDLTDQYKYLALRLNEAQAKENDGRGVSCVQTIVTYLNMGDIRAARAVARNESDKLWAYPEIRKDIHQYLEPIGYMDPDTKKLVK